MSSSSRRYKYYLIYVYSCTKPVCATWQYTINCRRNKIWKFGKCFSLYTIDQKCRPDIFLFNFLIRVLQTRKSICKKLSLIKNLLKKFLVIVARLYMYAWKTIIHYHLYLFHIFNLLQTRKYLFHNVTAMKSIIS